MSGELVSGLKCRLCGKTYPKEALNFCTEDFGPLEVTYDYEAVARTFTRKAIEARPRTMWRYRELLPVDGEPTVGRHVGGTPLIRARRLENGALEFLGRVDHQMKLSGYRIEPGEVEAALAAHPGVRESAVVVREDPHGEHRLVAYFVPRRVGGETPTSRSAGWSASSGNGDGPRRYRLPNGMEVVPHDAYQTNAVFKEVFEDRTYLRHGISLKEGDCVFDVGANIGLFTLFAHAECGRARIYAFEPLPPNFERLRSNVALNRVDAVVFPCGLADRPGRADFTFYPRLAALSGRFPSGDTQLIRSIVASFLREARARDAGLAVDAHDLDAVETYLESEVYGCELRTLSDVIDEHSVERIDLLKIDAEKSELDILRGLRDEHWPRVRQMVLEVHTRPLLDAILQLLERHGFDATYDRTVVVEHGSEFIYMLYAARRGERGALDPIAAHTLQVPAPGELRRFLRERLPDYMVPTAFVAVDAFPLTLNRKVDRLALPAPTWERPETETDFEPPREGTEVLVAALWAEVLGIARVGANDNFFDLGGASLQTLRVAERARAAGLPLIPELLFQYQTVRELAEALERRGPDRELPAEVGLGVIADPTGEETPADGRTPALAIAAENTVIESLAVYLPPRVVSTDEVLRGCSKRMLFPLERMTGIRTRRMAGDTEFSIDLAARAVADCLARSRHAPADIDLVVCCNISRFDGPNRFSFEPGTAVALRERFGLVSALAFDVSNACTGVFTAINLADAWLRSGAVRRVLVVSGEYISHLTATAQREIEGFMDPRLACLTLGDAGVAMVGCSFAQRAPCPEPREARTRRFWSVTRISGATTSACGRRFLKGSARMPAALSSTSTLSPRAPSCTVVGADDAGSRCTAGATTSTTGMPTPSTSSAAWAWTSPPT